eukprot:scaffold6862_cov92-Skeletonema_dohrnii-CCMP3373.AAC.8
MTEAFTTGSFCGTYARCRRHRFGSCLQYLRHTLVLVSTQRNREEKIVGGRGVWIEAISMCNEQRVSKVLNEDNVCHLACTVSDNSNRARCDHLIKTNASSMSSKI